MQHENSNTEVGTYFGGRSQLRFPLPDSFDKHLSFHGDKDHLILDTYKEDEKTGSKSTLKRGEKGLLPHSISIAQNEERGGNHLR